MKIFRPLFTQKKGHDKIKQYVKNGYIEVVICCGLRN